jgi:hypothetical protein
MELHFKYTNRNYVQNDRKSFKFGDWFQGKQQDCTAVRNLSSKIYFILKFIQANLKRNPIFLLFIHLLFQCSPGCRLVCCGVTSYINYFRHEVCRTKLTFFACLHIFVPHVLTPTVLTKLTQESPHSSLRQCASAWFPIKMAVDADLGNRRKVAR